ncbi:HAD-IA family hydrolase [Roseivivax sp. GX 12232]|uniref:HAD family hydrolase n=1 Tax=Roseivivax sp. GX 12232 TaxID=2900547 RepID=UPI001E569529|nr:HAD-IA family hydrolase [Roseivivax sp. GX 12232]MCE0506948.1 HAD-IA family hydrolase [Roseivivax sp. GX 12232]
MAQDLALIAWDFDGVLNDNIHEGRHLWARHFEAEIGHPVSSLTRHLSGEVFEAVVAGRRDLREAVAGWTEEVGYAPGPDAILRYWFERDANTDPAMQARLKALRARGLRQVIATNNEDRRCRYIEEEMGFGPLIDGMFSSGRMGVRKPFAEFFAILERETEVPPGRILLVDDTEENLEAASARGWQVFHYRAGAGEALDRRLGLG